MNRIPATVRDVEGDQALVETEPGGGCGHCHEPGGCRSGLIGGMFASGPRLFRVPNTIQAVRGERVSMCIPDGSVLKGAVTGYLIPVFALVMGAFLAGIVSSEFLSNAGGRDLAVGLGVLGGLGCGVLLNRWLRRRNLLLPAAPRLERENALARCSRETGS